MEDAQIVQLYWERSEQAIDETAAKYGPYCHSIAIRILQDSQDAEECVNDTYLSAWNAMPPHRPSVLATFWGRSPAVFPLITGGQKAAANVAQTR